MKNKSIVFSLSLLVLTTQIMSMNNLNFMNQNDFYVNDNLNSFANSLNNEKQDILLDLFKVKKELEDIEKNNALKNFLENSDNLQVNLKKIEDLAQINFSKISEVQEHLLTIEKKINKFSLMEEMDFLNLFTEVTKKYKKLVKKSIFNLNKVLTELNSFWNTHEWNKIKNGFTLIKQGSEDLHRIEKIIVTFPAEKRIALLKAFTDVLIKIEKKKNTLKKDVLLKFNKKIDLMVKKDTESMQQNKQEKNLKKYVNYLNMLDFKKDFLISEIKFKEVCKFVDCKKTINKIFQEIEKSQNGFFIETKLFELQQNILKINNIVDELKKTDIDITIINYICDFSQKNINLISFWYSFFENNSLEGNKKISSELNEKKEKIEEKEKIEKEIQEDCQLCCDNKVVIEPCLQCKGYKMCLDCLKNLYKKSKEKGVLNMPTSVNLNGRNHVINAEQNFYVDFACPQCRKAYNSSIYKKYNLK